MIICNAIFRLNVSRVYVQVYIVEDESQRNSEEYDKSSSILSSMKNNCQFSSNSKIANQMNVENDFICNEKS